MSTRRRLLAASASLLFSISSTLADQHWAFLPLGDPAAPETEDADGWARNPIDHFVLARLEALDLRPNPPVSDAKFQRRLHFDLHGLPPDPAVLDTPPDIAALLASPHFGERYARHWLDVVRYGDSMGYRFDDDTPNAYQFRDFVIRALNADMPFDQFVRWQIAGDELAPGDPQALAATGFAAVGPRERIEGNARNKRETRYNELDDIVSTTGSAFLALTLNCARCHDHKIDPIMQADYYGLGGAFLSAERSDRELLTREIRQSREAWEQRDTELRAKLDAWARDHSSEVDTLRETLTAERDEIWQTFLSKLNDKERANTKAHQRLMRSRGGKLLGKRLDRRFQQLSKLLDSDAALIAGHPEAFDCREAAALRDHAQQRPADPPRALTYTDTTATPVASPLLPRGSIENPAEPIPLRFVAAATIDPDYQPDLRRLSGAPDTTNQLAALARWLTDTERGAGHLLARVIANRVWFYHFGRALAPDPNDFGHASPPPAMPELLDHLAAFLIDHGWSLKALHRYILESATYRQGTTLTPAAAERDPENRYWHRRRPMRLEAEALRDTILAVSGRLNDERFGPGVFLPVPEDQILSRLGKPYPKDIADAPPVWRRSIYTFIKRTVPVPLNRTFDGPDNSSSCGRRPHTTVAPQALHLLNNPIIRKRATDFAERIVRECGAEPSSQVERAYLLALSRPPNSAELQGSLAFLDEYPLADFCQTLFTLNEFIYID
ncbi:MAG: DUF1549 and DUF1553 domain-containing protein [Verrucomicrobiales bacterium]